VDENKSLATFYENKKLIDEHNERYAVCNESYSLGFWKGSDLTMQQVNEKFNGLQVNMENRGTIKAKFLVEKTNLTYLNWAEEGYVTSVQYQGTCGACK